jgi:alpha-glucosidase
MFLNKLKIAVSLLVAAGLLGAGVEAGLRAYRATGEPTSPPIAERSRTEAEALARACPGDPPAVDEYTDEIADDMTADPPEAEPPEPPITAPPEALGCDPFYKKHISARGLPIVSSEKVSDLALREAAYLVNSVLDHRADIREAMIEAGTRFVVMHETEKTTDLPEQRTLKPKESWDRLRGLGDRLRNCGEENLLARPGDRYPGRSVLVHELGHAIHFRGLNRLDKEFDRKLRRLYRAAMNQGLWKGSRAASNHSEYWAEAVQSYFDCNRTRTLADAAEGHVNTREELEAYDPELFRLVDEVFRRTPWRYQPPELRD